MEGLMTFFANYGVWITVIAIAGIALLGVLKYCNLFKKFEESKRHYIYLGISVGFSVIAAAIYLLIVKAFAWDYLFAIATAMYALNQTFYAIFKVTPVNKLAAMLLDWVVVNVFKKNSKEEEVNEENKENS